MLEENVVGLSITMLNQDGFSNLTISSNAYGSSTLYNRVLFCIPYVCSSLNLNLAV
jgi:hypothetical protein